MLTPDGLQEAHRGVMTDAPPGCQIGQQADNIILHFLDPRLNRKLHHHLARSYFCFAERRHSRASSMGCIPFSFNCIAISLGCVPFLRLRVHPMCLKLHPHFPETKRDRGNIIQCNPLSISSETSINRRLLLFSSQILREPHVSGLQHIGLLLRDTRTISTTCNESVIYICICR